MDAINALNPDLQAFIQSNLKGEYQKQPNRLAVVTVNGRRILRILNAEEQGCFKNACNTNLSLRGIAKFVKEHQSEWHQQADGPTKIAIETQCAQLFQTVIIRNIKSLRKIDYSHNFSYKLNVITKIKGRIPFTCSETLDRLTTIFDLIEMLHKIENRPTELYLTDANQKHFTIKTNLPRIFKVAKYNFGSHKKLQKIYEKFVAKKQKMPDFKYVNRYINSQGPLKDINVTINYKKADQIEALRVLKENIDQYIYEHTAV